MLTRDEIDGIAERCYSEVYGLAVSKTRNKDSALEITQDTFVELVKQSGSLENNKIESWLMCVCNNKALAYLKKHKVERFFVSIEDVADVCICEDATEDLLDKVTYSDVQKRILSMLTPDERLVFTELFFRKKDIKIFAAENNISVSAANTRKSRVKNKVKSLYGNTYFFLLVLSFKLFH